MSLTSIPGVLQTQFADHFVLFIETLALLHGCAAFIAIDDMLVSHKNWDSLQMKQSSTWRELHCVIFASKRFSPCSLGLLCKVVY